MTLDNVFGYALVISVVVIACGVLLYHFASKR
jgi:hypothetical protein